MSGRVSGDPPTLHHHPPGVWSSLQSLTDTDLSVSAETRWCGRRRRSTFGVNPAALTACLARWLTGWGWILHGAFSRGLVTGESGSRSPPLTAGLLVAVSVSSCVPGCLIVYPSLSVLDYSRANSTYFVNTVFVWKWRCPQHSLIVFWSRSLETVFLPVYPVLRLNWHYWWQSSASQATSGQWWERKCIHGVLD